MDPANTQPLVVMTDDERYAHIMDAMTPMFAAIRELPGIVCPARQIDTANQVLNFTEHVAAEARQTLANLKTGNPSNP